MSLQHRSATRLGRLIASGIALVTLGAAGAALAASLTPIGGPGALVRGQSFYAGWTEARDSGLNDFSIENPGFVDFTDFMTAELAGEIASERVHLDAGTNTGDPPPSADYSYILDFELDEASRWRLHGHVGAYRDDYGWSTFKVHRVDAPLGDIASTVASHSSPEEYDHSTKRFDHTLDLDTGIYRLELRGSAPAWSAVTIELPEPSREGLLAAYYVLLGLGLRRKRRDLANRPG